MFHREIPVFLFTGFLESGKTSFILDTLYQDYFATGERTLIIACEEGEKEYDKKELLKINTYVEYVHDESELTKELFAKWQTSHKPRRVLIEYNGMWNVESVLEEIYPANWVLTQVISTIDYSTFNMYWTNMRSLVTNQFSLSDMVIFNRCDETAKPGELRRNIKIFNKKAQIGYDWLEGVNNEGMVEQLPYDLDAPVIEIHDDDYGIFYMDIMENPNKFAGKTVKYSGIFFRPSNYNMDMFVPGRFAMTCCADDITYLGMVCKTEKDVDLPERQWITLTAEVKAEYVKEYRDLGPVLYLKEIETGTRPEDDLVYF